MLTPEERHRFVVYLLDDAKTSEGMAEQMEKLGGAAMTVLAKKHRAEAMAMRIVAERLSAVETVTLDAAREEK